MENEYREIVRKYYEIYRPLQKKYNLRDHIHFDIYDDGLIEIWEYDGETKGKRICWVKEEDEIDCYRRAIEELQEYKRKKEEKGHEDNAVLAS